MTEIRPLLSALSWNVWFGGHRFEERVPALIDCIRRSDADLIALQEVTPEFLEHLAAASWVSEYQLSDPGGEWLDPYGSMVMSRLKMTAVEHHALPTQMGRKLVVADVDVGGIAITFATVHLESQDEAETRSLQLGRIFEVLARHATEALLVGDMNFSDGAEPETSAIDNAFMDVWPALRPDEPGYTVDTDTNRMRYAVKEKVTRKRIDRMFVRGDVRPMQIEYVGARHVGTDSMLFPSDHFGLKLRFSVPA